MKTDLMIVPQLNVNEIVWEKNIIRLPFNNEDEREKRIYELIRNLQTKVENLEKEKTQFSFLSLTDSQAKENIIAYLKEKKKAGHGTIEVFEIACNLRIPAPQVEKIIDLLESKGLVKELK